MTLDERMIAAAVQLIRAGRRTIEDVPTTIRQQVEQALNAADQPKSGE
ncbi:CD1375 family protein [Paenibacillus agricola]|uniref:Uncharacterized protein n=1 Tax=Paenibacillus agricola TaxID=2716264 RepID=A0ABX0IZL9_9BACL|nr:CD1375 family protein [Paenibacillus agricola]NHN29437.1 hypothetical protein [Paenibacillus agricola]